MTQVASPPETHLDAAAGYFELGLHKDAVRALDEIPPDLQTSPMVLRLRLKCALAARKWEIAEALALILRSGESIDREDAANAFILLAVIASEDAAVETAGRFIKLALVAKPECRPEILEHPKLRGML